MIHPVEDSSDDIALVAKGDGDVRATVSAIERLRNSEVQDVRVIAAQGCVKCPIENGDWLLRWLETELASEVRGWLYIAIAVNLGESSQQYLRNVELVIDNIEENEVIYLFCALSVAFSSRLYLLNLMESFYSDDRSIAREAVSLAKMLVDEESTELDFIDLLEQELQLDELHEG